MFSKESFSKHSFLHITVSNTILSVLTNWRNKNVSRFNRHAMKNTVEMFYMTKHIEYPIVFLMIYAFILTKISSL